MFRILGFLLHGCINIKLTEENKLNIFKGRRKCDEGTH